MVKHRILLVTRVKDLSFNVFHCGLILQIASGFIPIGHLANLMFDRVVFCVFMHDC